METKTFRYIFCLWPVCLIFNGYLKFANHLLLFCNGDFEGRLLVQMSSELYCGRLNPRGRDEKVFQTKRNFRKA